jgi:hypothetical protein
LERIDLGTAADFAILCKSGVTTTPGSVVGGNIGASPITVNSITGFGMILDPSGEFKTSSGSSSVLGRIYGADLAAPTPAYLGAALADLWSAHLDAASRVFPSYIELGAGILDNLTLEPGLYKWASSLSLTTNVIFDGCPTDIWILQIAGGVIVGASGKVLLEGGALPENIFWDIAGDVTVAAAGHLEGIFIATSITFAAGSSLTGAALVQTAVTLDSTTIVKESIA